MSNARIFISYSHRGNGPQWKSALLRSLHVFEQHHLLDVWEDGKIRVSSFWDDDIKQAMGGARLAVLLITKEALESEYILNTEFPFLRDRQQHDKVPVFPVICEECDWRAHDWLRATQAPNESNSLAQLSEAAQDSIFRQLATNIADALSHVALAELPQTDQPLSPDHVYLDKFPLTCATGPREEKLIGREQELALLDLAFAQPHTAIVSLVAWGGVGKTMLVQYWLRRLQREHWFGARRVYAWSFYSQGTKEDRQASEDTFLAHALEWFGVQCEPTLSPWDKGRLLADAVARERTLLILDGIEPLQYPPGPMGGQLRAPGVQSLLKQLARKANDSERRGLCLVTTREPLTDLADFERHPAAAWGSVLRVDLSNLTEEAGAALLHHAGAKRAGAAEIKAEDAELLAASREVDGHALTLNLLGRFLARAHSGDIRRRDLVNFEEADRSEQGGTTFKMLAAFENWFARSGEFGARQLAVLRMLGLFDRPADAGCINALRNPPVITGLTEPLFHSSGGFLGWGKQNEPLPQEDWDIATSFLADFGLIVAQANNDNRERFLDCHPLIREHFAKELLGAAAESWRAAHRRLYEHLCATTPDKPDATLEDLQPLYQAVAHGCQAGLQREAHDDVHLRRIRRGGQENYSTMKLGAFGSDLGALVCFFQRPWSKPSPRLRERNQVILLANAGFCLRALGRLTECLEPFREAVVRMKRLEDWQQTAIAASNLSELELTLGRVGEAMWDAEQSVIYADRSGNALRRVGQRETLADALHQAGRLTEAKVRFREAEQIQGEAQPDYPLLYSTGGFRYCDLLLAKAECAACQTRNAESGRRNGEGIEACRAVTQRATQTLKLAAQAHLSLLTIALDHLTLGRAALYAAILEYSDFRIQTPEFSHIDAAVSGLRRAGTQDHIPRGLLTRAWLQSLTGTRTGPESAQSDLDEAWEIAERGPMRLYMADIHLYRARLFGLRVADRGLRNEEAEGGVPNEAAEPYPWESPQADLAAAEKLINDCGYHRRDEELADAKKAILGQEL